MHYWLSAFYWSSVDDGNAVIWFVKSDSLLTIGTSIDMEVWVGGSSYSESDGLKLKTIKSSCRVNVESIPSL